MTLSSSLAVGTQQGVHLEEFSILPKKANCLHQGAQSTEEIIPTYCGCVCPPDCGHLICNITQSTDAPSPRPPSVGGGGGMNTERRAPALVPSSLVSPLSFPVLSTSLHFHHSLSLSFPRRNALPVTMLSSLQGNFTAAPNTWAFESRERSLCLNPSQALTDYMPLGKTCQLLREQSDKNT